MKKILKFTVLVGLSIWLITSCESKPEAKPTSEPTQVEIDENQAEEESVADEKPAEKEPVVKEKPKLESEPRLTVSYTEYKIVSGDTLSQIAERFYGNKDRAYFFPIIIAYTLDSFANIDASFENVDEGNPKALNIRIDDPDVIKPGMILRIPNFEEFMESPTHTRLAKPLFERIAMQYQNKNRPGVAKTIRERAERLGEN